jgi:hypothetical protein
VPFYGTGVRHGDPDALAPPPAATRLLGFSVPPEDGRCHGRRPHVRAEPYVALLSCRGDSAARVTSRGVGCAVRARSSQRPGTTVPVRPCPRRPGTTRHGTARGVGNGNARCAAADLLCATQTSWRWRLAQGSGGRWRSVHATGGRKVPRFPTVAPPPHATALPSARARRV